ncbi:DUF1330 domain-containing protein (plasmid) [Lichenicola cladoniae]|uniref:DUF1330 domain-containing protein n=1 Tax=Lichenicola cladoniae TaxID=1484109 RepID=A0A6M8HZ45_9PROT|nr:DUF1330 domain-containing protein [Lichenicola cladoniae]NPD69336.1 DUF1330 domain-containing protein [Acetobacteraceae bacterium]QKE93672.1 DUF1330 domain-containing protein [Lichenicola cladoniae]
MPAYFILDISVADPAKLEQYGSGVLRLIQKHGGEFIVQSTDHEVIEGNWRPQTLVIVRYPNRQAIHSLYNDPEYAPLKRLRHEGAYTNSLAVDGL